jgi:hypothetical protein
MWQIGAFLVCDLLAGHPLPLMHAVGVDKLRYWHVRPSSCGQHTPSCSLCGSRPHWNSAGPQPPLSMLSMPLFSVSCSAQCQRKHGALAMEGAGRPPGEPVENLWAVLGEHGWSTQYMHLHNRRGFLERALLWCAQAAAARLPETLQSMYARAVGQRARAATQIAAIVASLSLTAEAGGPEADSAQVGYSGAAYGIMVALWDCVVSTR